MTLDEIIDALHSFSKSIPEDRLYNISHLWINENDKGNIMIETRYKEIRATIDPATDECVIDPEDEEEE
jgi:hypothetical protein